MIRIGLVALFAFATFLAGFLALAENRDEERPAPGRPSTSLIRTSSAEGEVEESSPASCDTCPLPTN